MKYFFFCILSLSLVLGMTCLSCSGRVDHIPQKQVDLRNVEGFASLDTVTAESWILAEASSGLVIAQKAADRQMYPASLTKMMTCVLALENANMNDTVEISEDVYLVKISKSKLGMKFLMHDMLYELMLTSDNDAAYAVAMNVAGDTLRFYDMMNSKARDIGMYNTHFANPNGMPNDSNYTTASDLLKLTDYTMRNPEFERIVSTREKDVPLTDGTFLECHNTNKLLWDYEGCKGVKTGYTKAAGRCLTAAVTRDGVTLYAVVLKSNQFDRVFVDASTILNYGFNVVEAWKENVKANISLNP